MSPPDATAPILDAPPEPADLATGRRVLRDEAAGLLALADALDGPFTEAVALLAGIAGKVVLTGMGKSGHVARKIAATLASTGTPAFFVHPAEASHGDLGMIGRDDAVVALSNSGDTPELADLVEYTARLGVPLLAVTSNRGSALARAARVVLALPPVQEACSLRLAPTTSTTMMMALGDALAVALLERRGITADRFRDYHPGGRLGRRLLTVSDLMHRGDSLPLAPPGTSMADAILVMSEKGFGTIGIIGPDGALTGIVTDGDLRRNMAPDLLARPVEAIMTVNPRVIEPSALAAEALRQMESRNIGCLFVVDGERRPVGIIRILDCLHAAVA